jgi:hypothetical protein
VIRPPPELRCNEFVEMVTACLGGALDPVQERQFVDHIAGCDGCELYLDQVRRTVGTLRDPDALPADRLPDEARSALLDALRNRPGGSA